MRKAVIIAVLFMLPLTSLAIPLSEPRFLPPGVLPSNPFYFFKEWKRNISKSFIFSPKKMTLFELGVLNERAAEIDKLIKLLPEEKYVIESAIDSYFADLNQFNPAKEIFADTVFIYLKHIQLFTAIDNGNTELVEEKLISNLREILLDKEYLIELRRLLNKEGNIINRRPFGRLTTATALEEIDNYQLMRIKEDLLIDFLGEWIVNDYPDISSELNSRQTSFLTVLDGLRLKVDNNQIKSQLSILRQSLLREVEDDRLERRVAKMIAGQSQESSFHNQQAKYFFNKGEFKAALGQVTMAKALSEKERFFEDENLTDYEKEIEMTESYYNTLSGKNKKLAKEVAELSNFIDNYNIKKANNQVEKMLFDIRLKIAIAKYNELSGD